jgi:hypothetical protein
MGKVKKINIEGLLRWHDTFLSGGTIKQEGVGYSKYDRKQRGGDPCFCRIIEQITTIKGSSTNQTIKRK